MISATLQRRSSGGFAAFALPISGALVLFVLLVPLGASSTDELDPGLIGIGRLHYSGGGDWYSDPSSLPNLLREFTRRTGIPCAEGETVLRATDPGLDRIPFLYLTGHGNLYPSVEEEQRLRQWLQRGGFLWVDDNYGLDGSFRRSMERLFPEEPLRLVGADHPLYRSFYRLDGVPKIHEHDGKAPQGWGLFLDGRLAVFYTYEADIGDGLEDPQVHMDPPEKREAAMKMAVNILHHALTQSK